MTIPTFNPPIAPSPGTSVKPELKLLQADFGDGYTQSTRDGLNHMRSVVSLRWDSLTEAQADTIEAFFVARGGDQPFMYAMRGKPAMKWTCREWDRSYGSLNTVSATFRQDFSFS